MEQESEFADSDFAGIGDYNQPTKHNKLGSLMSKYDANNRLVSGQQATVLRKQAGRIEATVHARETKGIRTITGLAHDMGAPRLLADNAIVIFKRLIEKHTYRGYSLDEIAVACFYVACRESKAPRSIIEMEDASKISRKKIGNAIRLVSKQYDVKMPEMHPASMIGRIIENIPFEVDSITREKINRSAYSIVIDMMKAQEAAGKHPASLAATAVYLACRKFHPMVSQEIIGDASGISTVTLRERIKQFGAKGE